MAYNEVMEVKSVQLIPLDHEIERMLAFADMVFGPGINCPTFMDALSFRTIPLNTSKQRMSPISPCHLILTYII